MNYKEIVLGIEDGLYKMKMSNISTDDFSENLEKFKRFNYITLNDNEIFWMLTYVMFFNMGRKASMIEKKLPVLKQYLYGYENLAELHQNDIDNIINNTGFGKQIYWVISNSKIFNDLVKQYGSFKGYLETQFGIKDIYCSNQKLSYLYDDLKSKFTGIGDTAGWHFITELGFFSLKPDTVIRRIFYRLGLISSENNLINSIEVGRSISKELGIPIRYIDIIFVKFGQVGQSDLLGTIDGICTENNPKCDLCTLKDICNYNSKELEIQNNTDISSTSIHSRKDIISDYKGVNVKVEVVKNRFRDIEGNTIWELDEFMDVSRLYFRKDGNVFKIIERIVSALEEVKGKVNIKKRKNNDIVIKFKKGGNVATLWINGNSIEIRVVGNDILDKQQTITNLEQLEKINAVDIILKKAKLN